MRNISSLIEDFKPTIVVGSTVQAIATQLWNHFNNLYQQHIVHHPAAAVQANVIALNFIVAGYDPPSRVGRLFLMYPVRWLPLRAERPTIRELGG